VKLFRPTVIGIGGNLGSGKTTLAKIFQEFGAKLIDADKIGKSLLKFKTKEYHKIVETFGESILTKDKKIDRKKLGSIVFANPQKLKLLNRIVQPTLIAKIKQAIRKTKGIAVVDAALLFNWDKKLPCTITILVSAPKRLKVMRVTKLGMSRQEAERRLACQLPERVMAKKADFIIKNNGTKKDLRKKAIALWRNFVYEIRTIALK